jgi:probable phosphoglycerate mutase
VSVRLLLIRHGHVDWRRRDFLESPRGRQFDPPLSDKGREQARLLGARLQLMDPPAAVVSSPFVRCLQTLAPFLEEAGSVARTDPDLGEVFVGRWEGMGFEEIVGADEEMARRFREQDPIFASAPGGESGQELRSRVVPAVERSLEGIADGTVVVMAHGGVINAYLGHIMGIERDMFFLPENASINSVLVEGEAREMRFLNDVRHLTDPAIFGPPVGVEEHAAG